MAGFAVILLLFHCLLLSQHSYSLPLCTDFRAPAKLKTPLEFCPYNGTACCDSTKDLQLQKQFEAMNISDTSCASLLKSILCATCDPFAAELFKAKAGNQKQQKPVPGLCNSTDSGKSHSSKQSTSSFCSTVWNTCKDISILKSPFAPSLQGGAKGPAPIASNLSTLADLWQSEKTFCDVFGASPDNDSVCFAGEPVKLNNNSSETDVPPKGLCLEKIDAGSYISMAPHPDGSNRAFFSNLPGKIWLATIPEQDSVEKLDLDESDPFVDLTDQVLFDTIFGMLGMAFHPDFAHNGRFFASYNCDRLKSPECAGRCACNSDVDCDPSKFNTSGSSTPCQYQSVIAEYTANGSSSNPSSMQSGQPTEVRRIFTMGLPFTNNHGGQILFGPEDGYMYVMMGDGGGRGDPYHFSQNKKSILGKILRLDIDKIPSEKQIDDLGLWGNYSIPQDNQYSGDKNSAPEIWAMGLRNPWRCSFDADRPSYFVCGDVGQDQYEEIDIITKGGNYGWSIYEGPIPYSSGNETKNSSATQNLILPVAGYTHSQINKKTGSAAMSGGFFYRSETDPCMSGRYLYGDLYASNIWAATENPENSGNFSTAAMPFSCAKDSPLQCSTAPGTTLPALGYIYSFAQDNRKDVLILASTGVYRVVRPSRCNYACSKEIARPATGPTPSPSSPSSRAHFIAPLGNWLPFLLCFLILEHLYN
ncbi:HIPL1 protein-like [Chenopodium quinoa]|uniref:Glucose/Sorbosone dehydrogenase domain-containing protein n=1 Tax=Chenopodium quinoa TaxID=63459 RepID=A0A803MBL8_CHEQI|nr:HIPL1 protein-like [Chenopodium quinoa]